MHGKDMLSSYFFRNLIINQYFCYKNPSFNTKKMHNEERVDFINLVPHCIRSLMARNYDFIEYKEKFRKNKSFRRFSSIYCVFWR